MYFSLLLPNNPVFGIASATVSKVGPMASTKIPANPTVDGNEP